MIGGARVAAALAATILAAWSCRNTATPSAPAQPAAATGAELYSTFCAACHGSEGRGDGPAAPFCRVTPADLTQARFKVRSTPSGALPSDADLAAVIRRGAGGDGAMPSFSFLAGGDVDRLVAEVKAFSPRWQREPVPPDVPLPPRVQGDAGRGKQLYEAWGCADCHGPTGEGNGPRAKQLRDARGLPETPTDLTRPWRFKAGRDDIGLVRSVLTGFNGTTMPAYADRPGIERGVWDLAAFMWSLQRALPFPPAVPVDTSTVSGYWTTPVPEQGGELSSVSCAACHLAQFGDWSRARHAIAMSPGVRAQMNDQRELSGMCATCHIPLREQWTDPYLSADGVGCAACHARGSQRFGPPPLPTTLAPLVAKYPAPHGPVNTRDFFERVEFCAGCHQFAEGRAPKVNGAFLQNTVEEWRTSRAAREGKTCQTCHMPGRRHLFRGIHDPETVRSGVQWSFDARMDGDRVVSRLTLTNTNTGHAFPTYIVPEVWMRIELVDQYGVRRPAAEKLIARRVAFERGEWREISDTRLRQDETATLEFAGAVPPGALGVTGSVIVRPDAYHVGSLASHLRKTTSAQSRRSYELALDEMRRSDYVLFRDERRLPR
jgi:mono/diheme cytochrome c family protein